MFAAYKTRTSRECLDEYDDVKVEAMDFATLDTPTKWNSVCREAIWHTYDLMRPHTQLLLHEGSEWLWHAFHRHLSTTEQGFVLLYFDGFSDR